MVPPFATVTATRRAPRPHPATKVVGWPVRVGIVADYLEEGWPSMDLAAELTQLAVERYGEDAFDPRLLRPEMPRVLHGRFRGAGANRPNVDRYLARYVAYPRWLKPQARDFALFHVIDQSYAHLVHGLRRRPVVVTCHDLDAFRSVIGPERGTRPWWFRKTMRRVMEGLRRATHVICDTHSVRDGVVQEVGIRPDRVTVVHLPVHPDFTPEADPVAEAEAARFLGPAGAAPELLHVGINVPRKRLGFLLRLFARLRDRHPGLRLIRVGGKMTLSQLDLCAELEIPFDSVLELPFLERPVLAAVYRRAAGLIATSKREGFGWPVVEAMACGTPVVCSDLPVFREVGGDAATYVPIRDLDAWVSAVDDLLYDRRNRRQWSGRREASLHRAEAFSLEAYARGVMAVYRHVLGMRGE
jgi:glycosyltransferase involved in cell wall biosynthesis